MSRVLQVAAIVLGLTYVIWALLVLPEDTPPIGIALASLFCSFGSIATERTKARRAM